MCSDKCFHVSDTTAAIEWGVHKKNTYSVASAIVYRDKHDCPSPSQNVSTVNTFNLAHLVLWTFAIDLWEKKEKDNMLLGSVKNWHPIQTRVEWDACSSMCRSGGGTCVCLYWMWEPRCLTWVVCHVFNKILFSHCHCGVLLALCRWVWSIWSPPPCLQVRSLWVCEGAAGGRGTGGLLHLTARVRGVHCVLVPVWVVRVWSCAWDIVLLHHNTCKWASTQCTYKPRLHGTFKPVQDPD